MLREYAALPMAKNRKALANRSLRKQVWQHYCLDDPHHLPQVQNLAGIVPDAYSAQAASASHIRSRQLRALCRVDR